MHLTNRILLCLRGLKIALWDTQVRGKGRVTKMENKELILRHQPHIYQDLREPFSIRYIGCSVFREPQRSSSFPKWFVEPRSGEAIIEYAIYYDYDIQHLYELEHIWVAVDEADQVTDCWCSFHGLRLRAAGWQGMQWEDGHPVLYAQPGKHAFMPEPTMFEMFPDLELYRCCNEYCGGGLLIPAMFAGEMETNPEQDQKIRQYIRDHFSFMPSMEFKLEELREEQFISWAELREKIPQLVSKQLELIQG